LFDVAGGGLVKGRLLHTLLGVLVFDWLSVLLFVVYVRNWLPSLRSILWLSQVVIGIVPLIGHWLVGGVVRLFQNGVVG
jgi:hypothetical protein